MGTDLVESASDDGYLAVIPTKTDRGYGVLLGYADENFTEEIPAVTEQLDFEEDITGRTVTVWRIDKNTTNPYRLFEKLGSPEKPDAAQLKVLRAEGQLKPMAQYTARERCLQPITLLPNSVYMITVE